ncbi:MAG: relaxase domain-containing protein [Acidimicrobiales bacterium]
MIKVLTRRSNDVSYFTDDRAQEIDGLRDGGPGWWLRGAGDLRDPRDVSSVLQGTTRSAVLGYDIVVAAPRPTSILLAVDPDHGAGVVAAHRASVSAAIDYLEEHALVVRDRRGGEDRDVAGRWSGIVGFTHGVNRHGEPHLHDHVLVGAAPASSHSVLDSRGLFAHLVAADALYRASLRHELREHTPWTAWRSFEGVERVVGLDEGYRALWGGHHVDRGEKLQWGRRDAIDQWRDDRGRFEPLGIVEPPGRHRSTLDEHGFAGALEGRHGVARRHVITAWSNAARFGQSPIAVERAVDTLYPTLRGARGVREPSISVREARMTAQIRERGARPLETPELEQWSHRSRDDPRSRSERSR